MMFVSFRECVSEACTRATSAISMDRDHALAEVEQVAGTGTGVVMPAGHLLSVCKCLTPSSLPPPSRTAVDKPKKPARPKAKTKAPMLQETAKWRKADLDMIAMTSDTPSLI